MQEKLTVKNFLVIKKASIQIRRINIIIGPQAQGKSLLAKLLHYFKGLPDLMRSQMVIARITGQVQFEKFCLEAFEQRFPRYTWEGTEFEIKYELGKAWFCLTGTLNAKGKTHLKIEFWKDLVALCQQRSKYVSYEVQLGSLGEPQANSNTSQDQDQQSAEPQQALLFERQLFIPAARSFFATVQQNIFALLASDVRLDPFIKGFGKSYESFKIFYGSIVAEGDDLSICSPEGLNQILEAILGGHYESIDHQDWIVNKDKKVNLANASSGQQEALPMLLSLIAWPDESGGLCFIEEPEAHLFPTAQSQIVSMLAMLSAQRNTRFFITTHSPYIVSAFNNLILAADKVTQGALTQAQFAKMNGGGSPIAFEDVAAYSMAKGVARPIADKEHHMVGAEMLDEISEHFDGVMNKLLMVGNHDGL